MSKKFWLVWNVFFSGCDLSFFITLHHWWSLAAFVIGSGAGFYLYGKVTDAQS